MNFLYRPPKVSLKAEVHSSKIKTILFLLASFFGGFGTMIANALTSILAARLSRKDEYEADAYAAALLIKSEIGVEPQISMFEKLGKLSGESGQPLAWMMSHPKTTDRITAIKKLQNKWQ